MSILPLEVPVGNLIIGGNHPLVVQSMTNTATLNTEATVQQIEELYRSGCQLVRITARNVREAEHLAVIKKNLHKKGIDIPLSADIHFQPKAAETAARIVEKVRINPGNYVDKRRNKIRFTQKEYALELEKIHEKTAALIKVCNRYGTAVRIGINHGSLAERIVYRYGNTAAGMVQSALEYIDIFESENFHRLILSLKSSDVPVMIEANRMLVREMKRRGRFYPLHLGVTEAGAGLPARVKSAVGIGTLLSEGIGDTLRVSLTENPVQEIPFAKKLAALYPKNKKDKTEPVLPQPMTFANNHCTGKNRYPLVVSSQQCRHADCQPDDLIPVASKDETETAVLKFTYHEPDNEKFLIRASTDVSRALEKRKTAGIWIENKNNNLLACDAAFEILHALQLRFSKTEYVACPSCGRTRFDIVEHLQKVWQAVPDIPNLKIAVMGCIVNGLGEMGTADYGYVGTGSGKITLYKNGQPVVKNIPENEAVEKLVELLKTGFPESFR